MIREPNAFLMDEPLSSLDAPLRIQMRGELKKLQRELGATVLYVTHDQGEAMALADRVGVMNQGLLLQHAAPEEVYSSPASPFVAGFIGNPPANLLSVRVSKRNGKKYLEGKGFSYPLDSRLRDKVGETLRNLVLAIRPENIKVSTFPPSTEAVKGKIALIEPLGRDKIVQIDAGGDMLKAMVPPTEEVKVGQWAWLELQTENIIVFDGTTEKIL